MGTPSYFLDTNIFFRHLLDDIPAESSAAHRLFAAIEVGAVDAWTSPVAIAEIIWVLSNPRTYAFSRSTLRDALIPLLSFSHLAIEHKGIFPRALDLYVSLPIDYIDAYHSALIESAGQNALYSFDTDFDRVPGLQRREP